MRTWAGTLELRGPAGEPVSLARTLLSHGCADLPPARMDPCGAWIETVLSAGGATHDVRIEADGPLAARATADPGTPELLGVVARMLRLDLDLSAFYQRAGADPDLAWAVEGAGRMMRSPTVFEDLVKTLCTTNCAWSATVRMVTAIVDGLGPVAPSGRHGFPTAEAMAAAGEDFYRDVARAGYRGPYLRDIAGRVAAGELDLEALADPERPDAEVEETLLALPGIGPYATAHMLLVLGRCTRLVLDSWTRPTYARLVGRKKVADRTIERRFRRYGAHAGLAFWLLLTRDWVQSTTDSAPASAASMR